jgi:RNA polymerase sigma-B factor
VTRNDNSGSRGNDGGVDSGDGYENIEPWFEKLAGLAADDVRGRTQLREDIVRRCLPLAEHIARRFAGRGEAFDDIHQVARVGLVLAVDRFDVGRGCSFLSFAVPTIMGEVRRYFRDSTWALRVPRRMKELQQLIGPAKEALSHRLGRMPTARELAAELDVELTEITQALVASNAYQTNSLDATTTDDSDSTPLPVSETLGVEEPCYQLMENAMAVRPLIAALPEREREVLVMRYFQSKTQIQIAEQLGVSQMHVSRILSKTLRKLREQALSEESPLIGAA